jgi:hypothetical protein
VLILLSLAALVMIGWIYLRVKAWDEEHGL